ncbi:MAG: tetratricopeptide repeat protein [Phycisphaerales bacterium]|nr:tetratricopeptide repeat protein [Phycisphaerales bacterium]
MLQWIAQNTLVAIGIAVLAAGASLLLRRRPAAAHVLWMCVLVALLAPPVPKLAWLDGRAHAQRLAHRVERECADLLPGLTPPQAGTAPNSGRGTGPMVQDAGPAEAPPLEQLRPMGPRPALGLDALPVEPSLEPTDGLRSASIGGDQRWSPLLHAEGWTSATPIAGPQPEHAVSAPSFGRGRIGVSSPDQTLEQPLGQTPALDSEPRGWEWPVLDWRGMGVRLALLAWLAGAVIAAWGIGRDLMALATVCREAEDPDADLDAAVRAAAAGFGIAPPRVRVCSGVATPFVCGLVRPTLIWPASAPIDTGASRTVLSHELAHLARRDHWLAWLEAAAAVALWWHPLAHLARAQARRLAERACDAWVVWAHPEARRDYADALLDAAERLQSRHRPLPALGAVDSDKRTLARRLVMIMNGNVVRHGSRALAIGAIALTAALSPTWARADGRINPSMTSTNAEIDGSLRPLVEAAAQARRGAAFAQSEEWDRAIEAYQRATALRPDDAGAWHELAMALYNDGRYERAAKAFHKGAEVAASAPSRWDVFGDVGVRATTRSALRRASNQMALAAAQQARAAEQLARAQEQQGRAAERLAQAAEQAAEARARIAAAKPGAAGSGTAQVTDAISADPAREPSARAGAARAAKARAAERDGARRTDPVAAEVQVAPSAPASITPPTEPSEPFEPTDADAPAAWDSPDAFGSTFDNALAGFDDQSFAFGPGDTSFDVFGGDNLAFGFGGWGEMSDWAYNEACCLALAGQSDAALDALARAVGLGYTDADHAGSDSDLASLRDSDRFAEIVGHMSLLEKGADAAEKAFDDENWHEAAEGYAEAATLADHDAELLQRLALASLRAGDAAAAKAAWARVLEIRPDDTKTLYNLGCAEAALGNRGSAIKALNKAADAGFNDHELIRNDHDLDSLRDDERFEAVVKRVVGRAKLQREMQTAMEFEEWSDAAEKARTLLEQSPDGSWEAISARSTLGMALLRAGDYEGAEAAFRDAAVAGEGPANEVYNIACCRALAGDEDGAIDYLNAAVDAGYQDAEHMQTDEDLAPVREARAFAPVVQRASDAQILQQFGAVDWDHLRERAEARIAHNDEDGGAYLQLGWALLRTGKAADAIGAFQKQEELGEMPAIARYNIACCHAVLGHTDRAFEALKSAIAAGFEQADLMADDPDLSSLHADPRFEKLLQSMQHGADAMPGAAPTMPKNAKSRI